MKFMTPNPCKKLHLYILTPRSHTHSHNSDSAASQQSAGVNHKHGRKITDIILSPMGMLTYNQKRHFDFGWHKVPCTAALFIQQTQ